MNQPTDHLTSSTHTVRLSEGERTVMRARLRTFMSAYPLSIPSPYRRYLRPLAAALSVLIVLGAGTSALAEEALPGDALYPVKVSVIEPTIGALQISKAAKATWTAHLADVRLSEAQTLADKDRLTPAVQAQLAARIADAATLTAKQVTDLATSNPAIAVHTAVALDATLTSHQAALALLADSDVDESAPVIHALADQVSKVSLHTSEKMARAVVPAAFATSSADVQRGAAKVEFFSAVHSVGDAESTLHAQAPTLPATTTAAASSSVNVAHANLEAGKHAFDTSAYADATALFARAHAIAEQSKIDLLTATGTAQDEQSQ